MTFNGGVLTAGSGTDRLQIDDEATLAMGTLDVKAAGFETFYNYYGYRLLGTSAATCSVSRA